MNGTVSLAGREIPYVVRPSSRARRVSLRIREAGRVEVVVPAYFNVRSPEEVVRRHAVWILRTFDRLTRAGEKPEAVLGSGSRMVLLGRERTINILREARRRPAIVLGNDEIKVRLPETSTGDVRLLLQRWIRKQAETIIPARVRELNESWDLPYVGIAVRNQRTRWGSCSRKGALSFNWRLLILPAEVADYLIFHELAHLKYLDHSPRFWNFVEKLCPRYREYERWLRRNGRSVPL